MPTSLIPCVGCGLLVPTSDGPIHRYIGAAPGCWQLHGELAARRFGLYALSPNHQMAVDTYAVQHPGVPSKQAQQSVCVHLMSLCLVLERDFDKAQSTRALSRFSHQDYPWLPPPANQGKITIHDILQAQDATAYTAIVDHWACAVWAAWSDHHATIRTWVDQ